MMTQVRTARPEIMLGGIDFYQRLAPYLLRFSYTDNCDGEKADDLQFDLADRDRKFINDWMPEPGASLDAAIVTERWFAPFGASLKLDCGKFWIDDLEFDLPQHTVHVKCNSIPTDCYIKTSNESRPFEKTTLKKIIEQIAGENGMEPSYLAKKNPEYDAVEQNSESGLHFMKQRANDAGLSIKVSRGKVIVYDEAEMDNAGSSFTLVYGDVEAGADTTTYRMTGAKFRLMVTDVTAQTLVSRTDMGTGDTGQGQFKADEKLGGGGNSIKIGSEEWIDHLIWDPDVKPATSGSGGTGAGTREGTEGMVDNFTDTDPSLADKAKAHTRDKNKHRYDSIIELSIGNPLIAAGQVFTIRGCGQFDGEWFLESAHHQIMGMYTTTLLARKCLQGY